MNGKEVELHGGPWHGRKLVIDPGLRFITVAKPSEPLSVMEAKADFKNVHSITGTYSQVANRPYDYEWDGWQK
jgi:hypothetical protein